MNIAFVNSTRKWGGVKTWVLDFASQLTDHSHHVLMYGRQDDFVREARTRTGHGVAVRFGADLNPRTISFFVREFKKHHIQAVFINIGKDLCTAGVAARLLGIPVIQQIGLPHDIPYKHKTRLLHKWINPYFLCSSEFIRKGFLKSLPYLDAARVMTILTAKRVQPGDLTPHAPRSLVMTQQLNRDKDHATVFRALARLDAPFTLHVAGTGEIEAELKELARDLGLENKIIWHGFTRDIPGLLLKSDIFILASLVEGLPNTLQEALAAGLLPVIRDVGGVREVITPELEPWVLPYEAGAQEFADRLGKALFLSDQDLLLLKNQAQAACDRFCSMDRIYGQFEAWLEQIISKV